MEFFDFMIIPEISFSKFVFVAEISFIFAKMKFNSSYNLLLTCFL
jgi:hypothetical protein